LKAFSNPQVDPVPLLLSEQQQQYFSRLLQTEIELARALRTSLVTEHEALSHPDTSNLDKIVSEKQEKIAALEAIGKQRETQLKALGILGHSDTVHDVQRVFNSTRKLSDQWSELLALAADCQEKNRINGSIVELGMRHSIRALEILRGNASGAETLIAVYDHSGHTTSAAEKRSIAQA
jgi:flagella synthesis protein FlgN